MCGALVRLIRHRLSERPEKERTQPKTNSLNLEVWIVDNDCCGWETDFSKNWKAVIYNEGTGSLLVSPGKLRDIFSYSGFTPDLYQHFTLTDLSCEGNVS